MKSSLKDQAQGGARELKGKMKQGAGRATNNPNMEERGTEDRISGKVQRKAGEIEKVFGQ